MDPYICVNAASAACDAQLFLAWACRQPVQFNERQLTAWIFMCNPECTVHLCGSNAQSRMWTDCTLPTCAPRGSRRFFEQAYGHIQYTRVNKALFSNILKTHYHERIIEVATELKQACSKEQFGHLSFTA